MPALGMTVWAPGIQNTQVTDVVWSHCSKKWALGKSGIEAGIGVVCAAEQPGARCSGRAGREIGDGAGRSGGSSIDRVGAGVGVGAAPLVPAAEPAHATETNARITKGIRLLMGCGYRLADPS